MSTAAQPSALEDVAAWAQRVEAERARYQSQSEELFRKRVAATVNRVDQAMQEPSNMRYVSFDVEPPLEATEDVVREALRQVTARGVVAHYLPAVPDYDDGPFNGCSILKPLAIQINVSATLDAMRAKAASAAAAATVAGAASTPCA